MNLSRRLIVASAVTTLFAGGMAYGVVSSYYPVRPRLMCVMPLGTGATAAYFGFGSVAKTPFEEPVGDDNYFSPGPIDRGQPTAFDLGSSGAYPEGSFVVQFRGDALEWHLGTRVAVATADSNRCPIATVFNQPDAVAWVPPKAPEPIKVEPPKPKPPEPKAPPIEPTETVAQKPDATKKPTRKNKNHIKKKGQPKPKKKRRPKKRAPEQPRSEPVPLVLTGLTTLSKGVKVQTGEQDILGDASVAATAANTNVEVVDDPDSVPDAVGDGTGGVKKAPKRVAPRVRTNVAGVYPDDAPQLGRMVLVKLSLRIGINGRVKAIKVVRGAGAAFDREARSVAKKLVFFPATVDGQASEQWIPWIVEFTPDSW